ncbi:MAG: hypothetical protein ACUVQR_14120 [Thermogutta sp.]
MSQAKDNNELSLSPSESTLRTVRRPKTFERSPTTFARSREGPGRHPLDIFLAFLRLRFGSEFLVSSARLFFLCGKYGLLLGALLVFLQSVQKFGMHARSLLVGVGLALLLLICHYVVTRFLFVLERWERHMNGCLSSSIVPDALSLLAMVGSAVFLVLGTIETLTLGSWEFVFWGMATFIWGVYAALQALNLEGMNLQVNPEVSPADEILGLIQFALKMLVRLTPALFGVMVLVANLQLVVEIVVDNSETPTGISAAMEDGPELFKDDGVMTTSSAKKPSAFENIKGVHILFFGGSLPGITYLVYVLGHFISAIFAVFLAAVPERGTTVANYTGKTDLTNG